MLRRLIINLSILMLILLIPVQITHAGFYYQIDEQKEFLTVQQDGVIQLEKEFAFHVNSRSTDSGTEVWVGLPTSNTTVTNASFTLHGRRFNPEYEIEKGDEIYLVFSDFPPIEPGETGIFSFTAQIPKHVYWLNKEQLEKNPEDQRVSISYIPAWWDEAEVRSLTLTIQFEKNMDLALFQVNRQPTNQRTENGVTHFTWVYKDLSPDEKVKHAIILPRNYFSANMTPEKNWMPTSAKIIIFSLIGFGLLLIAWGIIYAIKNKRYNSPIAYMTGQKAYTSFDPVEAALFFNVSTDLLVKLITMGLIKKNVIQVNGQTLKRVPSVESLTWYEEYFLASIDENVNIIPEKWTEQYEELLEAFYEMIKGYCGRQTLSHYTNLLKKNTFTEADDPRWIILQKQLATGAFEEPDEDELATLTPSYLHSYLPLFYLTMIHPTLEKESQAQYHGYFPGATGGNGGSNTGSGCACACACACASSGGCT